MLISRHIIYTDNPVCCERIEIVFDPPIDIDSPLGKVGALYEGRIRSAKQVIRRPCKPVVNANGLLHVKEVMKVGELLMVRIRPGHRFRNLVLDKAHQLQVMPDAHRLQYWITAGQDGVVEVTGEIVKDDEGFFAKLKSNLKDIPYRAYTVQRSLADSKMAVERAGRVPEVSRQPITSAGLCPGCTSGLKAGKSREQPIRGFGRWIWTHFWQVGRGGPKSASGRAVCQICAMSSDESCQNLPILTNASCIGMA